MSNCPFNFPCAERKDAECQRQCAGFFILLGNAECISVCITMRQLYLHSFEQLRAGTICKWHRVQQCNQRRQRIFTQFRCGRMSAFSLRMDVYAIGLLGKR